MLLALDINSKRVGYAFGDQETSHPRTGSWALAGCENEDDLQRSCGYLLESILALSKVIHPTVIVYEAPFAPQNGRGSANVVRALFSLSGVAMGAGATLQARLLSAHVATWRKAFTGHGFPKNPKTATIEACHARGWEPQNHDAADAAGVWFWGMCACFPKWRANNATFPVLAAE